MHKKILTTIMFITGFMQINAENTTSENPASLSYTVTNNTDLPIQLIESDQIYNILPGENHNYTSGANIQARMFHQFKLAIEPSGNESNASYNITLKSHASGIPDIPQIELLTNKKIANIGRTYKNTTNHILKYHMFKNGHKSLNSPGYRKPDGSFIVDVGTMVTYVSLAINDSKIINNATANYTVTTVIKGHDKEKLLLTPVTA